MNWVGSNTVCGLRRNALQLPLVPQPALPPVPARRRPALAAGTARPVAARALPFDRLRTGFLLTFTLPAALRSSAQQQPRLIYNLLFRASATAAQELARDPRFIGGQLGLIGILQTWARNLTYHPHIHYLVPGGGWDPATQAWHAARSDFLLPVKALSELFRAKFRDGLRKHALFQQIPASVWQQDWVVHCLPVGNGAPALKYLAPYVFQVATPALAAAPQRRCKCQ